MHFPWVCMHVPECVCLYVNVSVYMCICTSVCVYTIRVCVCVPSVYECACKHCVCVMLSTEDRERQMEGSGKIHLTVNKVSFSLLPTIAKFKSQGTEGADHVEAIPVTVGSLPETNGSE